MDTSDMLKDSEYFVHIYVVQNVFDNNVFHHLWHDSGKRDWLIITGHMHIPFLVCWWYARLCPILGDCACTQCLVEQSSVYGGRASSVESS